jgi:DNA-binding MarR family transcriptional regulator
VIETRKEPQDKRATRVFLTQSGIDLISGMFEQHAGQIREFISPLESSEQEALTALLRKLEKAHTLSKD